MLIAAAKRTAEDTPVVWVSFPDFEWDKGVLDIRANEDRHFALYDFRERHLR